MAKKSYLEQLLDARRAARAKATRGVTPQGDDYSKRVEETPEKKVVRDAKRREAIRSGQTKRGGAQKYPGQSYERHREVGRRLGESRVPDRAFDEDSWGGRDAPKVQGADRRLDASKDVTRRGQQAPDYKDRDKKAAMLRKAAGRPEPKGKAPRGPKIDPDKVAEGARRVRVKREARESIGKAESRLRLERGEVGFGLTRASDESVVAKIVKGVGKGVKVLGPIGAVAGVVGELADTAKAGGGAGPKPRSTKKVKYSPGAGKRYAAGKKDHQSRQAATRRKVALAKSRGPRPQGAGTTWVELGARLKGGK